MIRIWTSNSNCLNRANRSCFSECVRCWYIRGQRQGGWGCPHTRQCRGSPCGCSVKNCRHSLVLAPQCFFLPIGLGPYEQERSSSRQVSAVSLAQWPVPVLGSASFSLALTCSLSLSTSLHYFVPSSGFFYMVVTPMATALPIPLFLSSFSFHDTIRRGGAGPC